MRRPVSGIALVALGCSMLAACGSERSPTGRPTDGPLQVTVYNGSQSLHPPKPKQRSGRPWWASVGTLQVCTDGPEVTVEALETVSEDELLEQRTYVYRPRRGGYLGVWGAAPGWQEAYASFKPGEDKGSYDQVPGATIDEPCAADPFDSDIVAVVPVMKTDAGGFQTEGFWIDYTADGDEYSLWMPWEITLCDAARQRESCGRR